ncbi:MAG: hypothetical protein JXR88_07080 [Clostridia bacterium]|nr:hypothetical protein [Clostridia bacterium]
MKELNIEEVLTELYDIDKKGQDLENKLQIVEDEFYNKLLENLKKSEREYMKAARIDAKKRTQQILDESIEEEQKIMETCYAELDRLDEILKNHKEELVKQVFEHVFLEE